jgi:hypothetical protein
MIESPAPTRAEATDVANAVLDHTSAVMLSAETAIGRDPVGVVRTMARLIGRAEQELDLASLRALANTATANPASFWFTKVFPSTKSFDTGHRAPSAPKPIIVPFCPFGPCWMKLRSTVQSLVQRAAMVEEYMSRRRVMPHARHRDQGEELLGGKEDAVRWHMIGHLQRNKAKKAIEYCRLVHSVDSLRLAEEVQQVAVKREQPVEVLVQVNASGEASKGGFSPGDFPKSAETLRSLEGVRVRGSAGPSLP